MSSCQINLLPDDPTREDFFGSHREVARAIADLVLKEKGGKAIALEGIWGSGKSTTVRLLEQQLSQRTGDGSVFVFDAWAHRGDPLRRSFIEELVRHLSNTGWINKQDWKARVEELSHRRIKRQVESEPLLTPVGKWMILLLFLVPFGFALFTASDASTLQAILGKGFSAQEAFRLQQTAGGILALAPVALALGVWGINAIKRRSNGQRSGADELNVLGLFISEVHRREISTKVSTPDPTSVEFRDLFSELLTDGLSQSDRHLVVVIDNLDRIDAHEALKIWSTMRTFFELNASLPGEWIDQFWLLVPYDKQSLRRLWRAELEDQQETSEEAEGTEAVEQRADAAEAFIDKSFQVRFRVSPPVRSDWRDFFTQKLCRALPAHTSEDQSYRLYQIYHQSRDAHGIRVTPRDIVLFLNQLGALHRQLGHDSEIPFEMQALFAAFQDRILRGSQLAEDEDLVPARLRRLLDTPRWREYLAALYYNVGLDKSLQVLIGEDVEQALGEGDTVKLREHQGVPGFSEVCVDRLELKLSEWRESEPTAIARAALAVKGLEEPLSPGSSERFWGSLQDAVPNVEDWTPFDSATGRGLVAILENTIYKERSSLQEAVIVQVSASCPTNGEEDLGEDDLALNRWVEGAAEVLKGVYADEGESTVEIVVPGGPDIYVQTLHHLQSTNLPPEHAKCFITKADGAELVNVLKTRVTEGEVHTSLADNAVFMDELGLVSDWNPLGSTVAQQLNANQTVTPGKLEAYCLLLEELAKRDSVPGNHMQQMTLHGHLHHRLWEANQANNPDAMAACAVPIFIHNPAGNQQQNVGRASNGRSLFQTLVNSPDEKSDVVRKMGDLIARFGYATRLLEDDEYRNQAPILTSRLLGHVLADEEALQLVSPSLLLDELSYLQEQLSQGELDQVLRRYGSEPALYEHAVELDVDENSATLHTRVYGANSDRPEAKSYEERLAAALANVSQDQWNQQLDSEGSLVQLALELLEEDADLTLGTAFRRAVQEHLTRILAGKTVPSKPKNWRQLLQALEEHDQSTLLDQIVDQIASPSAGHTEIAIKMYGDLLLNREDELAAEAKDVVGNLCTWLIQRQSVDGIRWVRRLLEECPAVWRKAPANRRKVLAGDVETELRATDSSVDYYNDLKTIADMIDLGPSNSDD